MSAWTPRPADLSCCSDLDGSSFTQWRRQIASSFVPMEVLAQGEGERDDIFRAGLTRRQLGTLSLSVVRADAHRAVRSAAVIGRHPASYVKMSCQLLGSIEVTQGSRTAVLQPGDFALYDTSEPHTIEFITHAHCLVIQVPHDDLGLPRNEVRALCAERLAAHEFLPGLTEMLQRIAEDVEVSDRSMTRAGQLIGQMIALDLHRLLGRSSPEPVGVRFDVIERYALAQLANPDLSLRDISEAVFLSTRHLQRLFQARGTTFSLWLRDQRTARAQELVVATQRPISVIAADCGFRSASDFSRNFRRRFGQSAREMRQAHSLRSGC